MIEIIAHQWESDRMKSTLRSLPRAFGLLGLLELSFHKFANLKTAQCPLLRKIIEFLYLYIELSMKKVILR